MSMASHQIIKELGLLHEDADSLTRRSLQENRKSREHKAEVLSQALETLRLIDEIRADEASSLTLFNPNPDFNGQPNCLIEISGDHTGYCNVRFSGDTLLECLRSAHAFMNDKEAWKNECPTEEGRYLFRSDENREAMIYVVQKDNGVLRVHSEIGDYPIQMFHDNLTNPQWGKIANNDVNPNS